MNGAWTDASRTVTCSRAWLLAGTKDELSVSDTFLSTIDDTKLWRV